MSEELLPLVEACFTGDLASMRLGAQRWADQVTASEAHTLHDWLYAVEALATARDAASARKLVEFVLASPPDPTTDMWRRRALGLQSISSLGADLCALILEAGQFEMMGQDDPELEQRAAVVDFRLLRAGLASGHASSRSRIGAAWGRHFVALYEVGWALQGVLGGGDPAELLPMLQEALWRAVPLLLALAPPEAVDWLRRSVYGGMNMTLTDPGALEPLDRFHFAANPDPMNVVASAGGLLRHASSRYKPTLERERSLVSYVQQAMTADAFGQAMQHFAGALELEPTMAYLFNLRGQLYLHYGHPDEAVMDFSRAIELDPYGEDVWAQRGAAYVLHMTQPEKGLPDLSRALELHGDHADTWYTRGVAYLQTGQLDAAVMDLDEAMRLGYDLAVVRAVRGSAHFYAGRFAESREDLDVALRLDSENANTYATRGQLNANERREADAVSDFENALAIDPSMTPLLFPRGVLYARLGRRVDAMQDLQHYLRLHNTSGEEAAEARRVLEQLEQGGSPEPAGNRPWWRRGKA